MNDMITVYLFGKKIYSSVQFDNNGSNGICRIPACAGLRLQVRLLRSLCHDLPYQRRQGIKDLSGLPDPGPGKYVCGHPSIFPSGKGGL